MKGNIGIFRGKIESSIMFLYERKREREVSSMNTYILERSCDILNHIFDKSICCFMQLDEEWWFCGEGTELMEF